GRGEFFRRAGGHRPVLALREMAAQDREPRPFDRRRDGGDQCRATPAVPAPGGGDDPPWRLLGAAGRPPGPARGPPPPGLRLRPATGTGPRRVWPQGAHAQRQLPAGAAAAGPAAAVAQPALVAVRVPQAAAPGLAMGPAGDPGHQLRATGNALSNGFLV